jgi:hypothetical protein
MVPVQKLADHGRSHTPQESDVSEFSILIDAHLAADADPDASRRVAVAQRIWAADGPLIDPPLAAEPALAA